MTACAVLGSATLLSLVAWWLAGRIEDFARDVRILRLRVEDLHAATSRMDARVEDMRVVAAGIQTRLETMRATANAAADVMVSRLDEAEEAIWDVHQWTEEVHEIVEAEHEASLQTVAALRRRLALLTGRPDDMEDADQAERALLAHQVARLGSLVADGEDEP